MKKSKSYRKLDQDTLKEISNFVIERFKEEETTNVKGRYDRRRGNVKLLLRNYRSLVDHCNNAVFEAAQIDDDFSLQDLLDHMGNRRRQSVTLESIRASVARTRMALDHINVMLELYRVYCERSLREEDKRRYRAVYWMYLAESPKKYEEIASIEHVDVSTVYKDISASVETLTGLIFGVDGMLLRQ